MYIWLMPIFGILVGIGASFTGLGGGFLMVPLLIFLGFSARHAVGTSFLGIFVISVSALFAHGKLAHVDYKTWHSARPGRHHRRPDRGAPHGLRLHGQLQKDVCGGAPGFGGVPVL